MRPRQPALDHRPPSLPEAIARFDELSLAPRPSREPLTEALAVDPDLARRMEGRERPHGRLSLRACLVEAALARELERQEAAGHAGALRRGRLHGLTAARLGRMARVHLQLPAVELGLIGPVHALGACLAGVDLEEDRGSHAVHARHASALAVDWGLSGAMAEALEQHHASFEGPPGVLLALSEHIAWAVETRRPEQAECPRAVQWSRVLGMREAELGRAVELSGSDWAGIAA